MKFVRPEVFRQRVSAHFADGARQFHAGRSSANHDEGQTLSTFVRIAGPLRSFKRRQDAAANLGGLFKRFQAGRKLLPLIVTKSRSARLHRPGQGGHTGIRRYRHAPSFDSGPAIQLRQAGREYSRNARGCCGSERQYPPGSIRPSPPDTAAAETGEPEVGKIRVVGNVRAAMGC